MNIKKLLIILIVVSITVILILTGIKLRLEAKEKASEEYHPESNSWEEATSAPHTQIDMLKDRDKFFVVKNAINKYYINLAGLNMKPEDVQLYGESGDFNVSEYINEMILSSRDTVYSLLDDDYIKEFNVTKENLKEKLGEIKESVIQINKIYTFEKSVTVSVYFTYGTIRDVKTSKISEFTLMVKLDSGNNTFAILPYEYMDKKGYNNVKVGDVIDVATTNIINKTNNMYTYKNIVDEDMAKEYFNSYKMNILYNVDAAYNSLDKNYRETKFGSLEQYKKYIDENRMQLTSSILKEYNVTHNGGYTQYVCIDEKGKSYTFNEMSIMQYTLIIED